ncbi:MAG: integral rane sensor signal transduction histidine kinase [Frankiales bacterium]|nr:integral rane sensor signal transduction histidine kinase [Frankiales bacterium]
MCALALAHLPVVLALVLGRGTWLVVTGACLAAEAVVIVVLLRTERSARRGQERLTLALHEGHASMRARQEETEQIRSDLIATVSHEFRTPLTGIRGAALTLLKRGDRLDTEARARLLHAVLDQQERLSRLLENMLTASSATSADPGATAEVDAVAAEVAMLTEHDVSVVVEPGLLARIDRQALHQVLANLLDNALQYGLRGTVPLVAGGREGGEVWLAVSNEGTPLDGQRLFEPFTQADNGPTREHEGLGMGLYVVRRLIEVHGGLVSARCDDGWVTVEVRLPAAEDRRRQLPTALPIP